jgi:hypothetical protein
MKCSSQCNLLKRALEGFEDMVTGGDHAAWGAIGPVKFGREMRSAKKMGKFSVKNSTSIEMRLNLI